MSRKPVAMPDLDDDADFRRKLTPLVNATLPNERRPHSNTTRLDGVSSGIRDSGYLDDRNSIKPGSRRVGRISAAEEQIRVEKTRGEKRRFEYLIPERVGRALAADAVAQGKSATTRLLEVLRDAGYPVIQEDLVDLRKMPKR